MKFIILDTETTGILEEDRVCQLAMMVTSSTLLGNEVEEIYEDLCKPPIKIGFMAMSVHHITNEMVEKKKECKDTNSFIRLNKLNLEENFLVIQNAPFDLDMLKKEGFVSKMQLIDTLRCLRHIYPDFESHSLQYVRYALGLYKKEQSEASSLGVKILPHDALGDVMVLKLLLDHLLLSYTVYELVELTKKPIEYKHFSFGKYKGMEVYDIALKDPGYLEWLLSKERSDEDRLDDDWVYTLKKALKCAEDKAVWIFPFGKYKGQSIEEIALHDKEYLKWSLENMDRLSDGMKKAIRRNLNI